MGTTVTFGNMPPPPSPPVDRPDDGGDGRIPRLQRLFKAFGLAGRLYESGLVEVFVLTEHCVVPTNYKGEA